MSGEPLQYTSPEPARPGLLRVAFWLLVIAAVASLLMPLIYLWMMQRLVARGADPIKSLVLVISMVYCIGFTVSAVICAVGISRRRWRKLSRVLAIFPLCLFLPLGTIAGLFTYIILGSPKIRAAYEHESRV